MFCFFKVFYESRFKIFDFWSVGCTKQVILISQVWETAFSLFSDTFPVCFLSLIVHRKLTDSGERDAEKARRRGHNNQTEQKEAQAHPTAAHVPTAQSKFSI